AMARPGPAAPLATSRTPAAASGPNPATRYRDVPETVPVPTLRRSTPRARRPATYEKGMAPTAKDSTRIAAACIPTSLAQPHAATRQNAARRPNSPTRPRHGHPGHVRLSVVGVPKGGTWVVA